jgi:hypothetical protein
MKSPSDMNYQSSSDSKEQSLVRAKQLTDLLLNFASAETLAQFYHWFNELRNINKEYPNNASIQEMLLRVLRYAIRLFGDRHFFADMLYLLDELERLCEQAKDSEKIAQDLAEGYSTAIYALRGTWDVQGTALLFKKISQLAKRHPKNRIIQLHLVKSYSNAIKRFCAERHNFLCEKYLFDFRLIANKHPKDEEIQYEYAYVLVNLIGNLARDGLRKELDVTMKELRKTIRRFPDKEHFQLLLQRADVFSSVVHRNR